MAVGPLIIDAIRSEPTIFTTTFENQFEKLILEPFSKVEGDAFPNLIVVDGLDECRDLPSQGTGTLHSIPSQARLLRIVENAITFSTPNPFIFFLCSRPEPEILNGINRACFVSCLKRIPISYETIKHWDNFPNTLRYRATEVAKHFSESDRDIQRYFLQEFTRLRREHPALQNEDAWPSTPDILTLVWKASGQFIFAVTVIKYIDRLDELPQERLRTILDLEVGDIADSPYGTLDLLYRQILSVCRNWDRVYPILRLLVTPHLRSLSDVDRANWRSPSMIAKLLGLKPGEVKTLLSRLHSVIHVLEDDHSDMHIQHASFTDFLLNRARSGVYHVPQFPTAEYCDIVAVFLLRALSTSTSTYPPFHSSCQPFHSVYSFWKCNVVQQPDLERKVVIFVRLYLVRVESPSSDLLAELDALDPYLLSTLIATVDSGLALSPGWLQCLTWAKSLRERKPQRFIARMESFLQNLHVGFRQSQGLDLITFIRGLYATLFRTKTLELPLDLLVVPAAAEFRFPGDWMVVCLKEMDRAWIESMCDGLCISDRRLLTSDVLHDTPHTIHCGLFTTEEVARLKAIFVQRGDWRDDWVPCSKIFLDD
ncbi:hypothetical protein VNI00_017669 [Paramarasmius palmivorus]|uniref:NACHT domain-containing protein n=1 Tax=Paramarasmius palmivorus TaxID=297713 RepID=A0AAW0B3L4_9AGAR